MTQAVTLEAIEAFMAERRATLEFPDWLERKFQSDRQNARCRRLARATVQLIFFYNLFLIAPWYLTPDVWRITLFIHLAIVTPWMVVAVVLFQRGISGYRRELVAASLPILMSLEVLLVYAQSRSSGDHYYQNLVLLMILIANNAENLPHRLAIVVSWFIVIVHAATLMFAGITPLAEACLSSAIMATAAYTTLATNHALERDERRIYLQKLRDRLQHEKIELDSLRDPLTGLANRRALQARLEALWAAAADRAVGILIADIDHFKTYNDRYGHPAGDSCLKRVAFCIQGELRDANDLAVRYGGEEVIIVLEDADVGDAAAMAERIRERIEGLGIPHERSGISRVVTASFGVAAARVGEMTADELIASADAALYAAKNNGRNQVFPRPMRAGGLSGHFGPFQAFVEEDAAVAANPLLVGAEFEKSTTSRICNPAPTESTRKLARLSAP